MGDAFLVDSSGHVLFLDTLEGAIQEVAPSVSEFAMLIESGANRDKWFLPGLVEAMEVRGEHLQPGQCYSFKLPPVLNGPITAANLHVTDALIHFSIAGQLHEQVRRLPEGTRISRFVVSE
jgi:hypothetical protein